MKFGVHHNTYTYDGNGNEITRSLLRLATEAEKLGFDSFWLSDHVHQNKGVGGPEEPMLDSWTALSALATATSSIRLGTMVTANPYRFPGMLAKIGATLDVLSNGRLFMGIGAANYGEEAVAYGIPFPPPGERLRRLSESVQILLKMWTEDVSFFNGKYYQIKDAFCNPKPIQKPHPPILVGGGGEKKTLKIVAQFADACNLIGGTPEIATKKLAILREHCKRVGRNYSSILKTKTTMVALDVDKEALEKRLSQFYNMSDPVRRQGMAFGTPEDVRARVEQFRDAGIEYFIIIPEARRPLETMKIFAEQVMKSF